MSTEEKMTPQQAELMNELYAPAFVEKMSSLGREIPDVQTLEAAMELAAHVKQALQTRSSNSILEANFAFKRAHGIDTAEAAEAQDNSIKTAARKLGANPDFRKLLLASN